MRLNQSNFNIKRFTNFRIQPSYRYFVYCTSIRNGGAVEWKFASEQYDSETDSNARSDLQNGMSCTKEPWLIKAFLADQLNSTKVRTQDTISGIRLAARSQYAIEYTWNFVKENWNEFYQR